MDVTSAPQGKPAGLFCARGVGIGHGPANLGNTEADRVTLQVFPSPW